MKATSSCLFLLVLHAGVEAFAWVAPRAVAHMKRPRGGENLNLALVPEPSSPAQLVTRVAFQGEPGAYSEKATRELLGKGVMAEGKPTFEDVFRAVSSREADYAVVPIENTLGGSIHANYDLMLRYDLYVIGEHEFRVEHSLMALPGTKIEDLKTVMSHAQALAQCDNYLRGLGVERKPVYDTAGSAKLIAEGKMQGVGAIASELAASTYGLEVLASNCEDDHVNFTRFLLLARAPVGVYMPSRMPAKTSIVFTLPNAAGALYKALACFSLRDIDFSKIESRPTSAQLLQHLRMRMDMTRKSDERKVPRGGGSSYMPEEDAPRFQYCFYLDFLASELKTEAQAALSHLKELSPYVRVLGSYPSGGTLVGPVSEAIKVVSEETSPREDYSSKLVADDGRLRVGIVGFGKFGQFLSKSLSRHHTVSAMGRDDTSSAARTLKIPYFPVYDQESFFRDLDVIIFSVSIVSFEEVLRSVPTACLRGKLIVDVLSVKMHAKHVMLDTLPPDADILCTHPMFGPESGKVSWQSLPFLYDKVRVSPEGASRCDDFLASIAAESCKMVEMSCELHDEYAANTQFITHLMGRILGEQGLMETPIDTRGFQSALRLMETTCSDSFDLFYGLYKFNPHSHETLRRLRDSFAHVERQLAAKEAYMAAKAEMATHERQRILAEVRGLLQEAARSGAAGDTRLMEHTNGIFLEDAGARPSSSEQGEKA